MAPRQPILSPESRRLIQSERRNLQRQAATAAEKRLKDAREQMRLAQHRLQAEVKANNENALINGIKGIVSTVASSYGVLPPMNIGLNTYGRGLVAYTDFQKVVIKYPPALVPQKEVGSWNPTTLRNFYADIKGISYHEVGHLLFTVPFPDLVSLAKEEGWTVPVYNHTDITGKVTPVPIVSNVENLHMHWNLLEDQRMETALVSSSPVMADFLTTMVLTHIANETHVGNVTTWLLLVGRRYLPRHVRLWFQDEFTKVHGIDTVHAAKDIVTRYKTATTASDMMNAVADIYVLLTHRLSVRPPDGVDQHENPTRRPGSPDTYSDSRERIQRSADTSEGDDDASPSSGDEGESASQGDEDESDSKGGGKSDSEPEDGEDGEDGGSSDGDKPDDSTNLSGGKDSGDKPDNETQPTSDESAQSQGSGNGKRPETLSDDQMLDELQNLIDQARDAQEQDKTLDEAVRATYETANSTDLTLPRTQHIHTQYGEDFLSTAETVARGLEQALQVFTAENSPIWQSRQSRGVIDPFAYRTRQSGSTDYRRLYQDGDIGTDISVVLMLDTSGSMQGTDEALGLAAYATKRACETVGVPCTVLTFDYDTRIVWTSTESAEPICLAANGGTNPTEGLAVLGEFDFGKTDQLVVLMTDGQFDNATLTSYQAPGRHFLGLGYGPCVSKGYMDAAGFHESHLIGDLQEVPQIVANFLAAYIRG